MTAAIIPFAMTMRGKWIFSVLVGVLLVGASWFAMSKRQPNYQGRPLAYWLCVKNNDDDEAVRDEPRFEEAIRHMDTNCLPFLLEWIAYEPPAWKTKLIDILSRPRWIPEDFQEDHAERLAEGAADAFRILGPRASPTIPQLARLSRNPSRRVSAFRAANALIGFAPEEAQPIIIDMLSHPEPFVRKSAISWVGGFGANASPAIPQLITCLRDHDEIVALMAAAALGNLRLRPELSVPALTNALRDARRNVALGAAASLGRFGLSVPAVRGPEKFSESYSPDNSGRRFAERYVTTNPFQRLAPRVPTNEPPAHAD